MSSFDRQMRATALGAVSKNILLLASEAPVPQVGRGRPPLGPRIRIRMDRGGPNGTAYLVRADGTMVSLGIDGHLLEEAKLAAKIALDVEHRRMIGKVSPMQTLLKDVFDYEKKKIAPGKDATKKEWQAYKQRVYKLNRLIDFFGEDATIEDITPDRCEEYGEWLLSQHARPGSKNTGLMSAGTLRMDIAWGRAAINRWAKRNNKVVVNGFQAPPRPGPRQHWLTRREVARLCASVLWGWTWDERTSDWAVEQVVDHETGTVRTRRKVHRTYKNAETRRRARMAIRAILIMYYTGTRSGRVKDLVWAESQFCGWIDVDREVICRSGMLVGKWAGPGKAVKPAGTSLLPDPLLRLVKRWHRADGKRDILVIIHKADGDFFGDNALYDMIKPASIRAGLSGMVVHEFRHSCVTHCLRAGLSVAETAAYVDMSELMVRTVYGHVAEEGTKKGALAMADKSVKPKFTSRQLAALKPPSLMRAKDVVPGRLIEVKVQPSKNTVH